MAQTPKNFVFSSDYPTAYITYIVVKSINVSHNQSFTLEFNHGLDYIPLLDGYWSDYSDFRDTNVLSPSALGTPDSDIYFYVSANSEKVAITGYYQGDGSKTIYIKLWGFTPTDYNGQASPVYDNTSFMLDTDYAYLSLYAAGTTPADSGTTEIIHNLGYVPQFKIWQRYEDLNGVTWVRQYFETNIYKYNTGTTVGSSYADKEKLYVVPIFQQACYYHIYTCEGDTDDN